MLKIGDFAKLSRVPVKTLRYYDEIGLLKPDGVDHYTRYRYYSAEQLPVLYRILELKELGFPLEQITQLLQGSSLGLVEDMLHCRRAEIMRQIQSDQKRVEQVVDLLAQLKREGALPHFEAVLAGSNRKERITMQSKIVNLEKFLVVGMPYLGKNEHGEIARMWQEFIPRIKENQHIAPGPEISYGLCSPNAQGLIDYVASLPVTSLADIPPGMVGKEVPAQTYVVFEVHGIKDIGGTYDKILKEWLPSSGYKPGDGPDFELYPETFDSDDPDSLLYIYFPIN
jgi:predicted transcriptional regulator YdeE